MSSIKSLLSFKTSLKLSLLIVLVIAGLLLFQKVFGVSCFCSDDRPFPVIWWDIYQTKQKIDFRVPTYLPKEIGKKHPEQFEQLGTITTHNLQTRYDCGEGSYSGFLINQGPIENLKSVYDDKRSDDEFFKDIIINTPHEIIDFNGNKGYYTEDVTYFAKDSVRIRYSYSPEYDAEGIPFKLRRHLTFYTSKSRIELTFEENCDVQNSKEELIKIANSLKVVKKPFLLF